MSFIKEKPKEVYPLEVVLQHREIKAKAIQHLAKEYGSSVIGIRINIPGESKKEPWAFKLYQSALEAVTGALNASGTVFVTKKLVGHYEYLALIVAKEELTKLKDLCVYIEETHPMGRCFDLDVYMPDGTPLSRGDQKRKCFLCDAPAHECARSKAHDTNSLRSYLISQAKSL